jgi:sucrose-6-phosphate hydrolase SacC (GH32 family)
MVEVFANEGETVITERFFPTRPMTKIEPLNSERIVGPVTMWKLRGIWN